MRLTSHAAVKTTAAAKRRLTEIADDDSDNSSSQSTNTRRTTSKRQKTIKTTTTAKQKGPPQETDDSDSHITTPVKRGTSRAPKTNTKNTTAAANTTTGRGKKTQNDKKSISGPSSTSSTSSTSATSATSSTDTDVDTKSQKLPTTPYQSSTLLLSQRDSPKTPWQIKQMMNSKEEESIKPIYETEALQITELCAFKVDHTAYNSYLYTGKMKIPAVSNIAREDQASSVGASVGKNIKGVYVRNQNDRNVKKNISFNLDSEFDDDDDDDDDGFSDDSSHENKPPNTISAAGLKIKTRRATTYVQNQILSKGGSNMCLIDDSDIEVRPHTRNRNVEMVVSLENNDNDDFETDEEESDTNNDDDGDDNDDDDDDDDSDIHSQQITEDSSSEFEETTKPPKNTKNQHNNSNKRVTGTTAATRRNAARNQVDAEIDEPSQDNDNKKTKNLRAENRRNTINNNPIQTHKEISHSVGLLTPGGKNKDKYRHVLPIDKVDPEEEFKIVDIVVKYPLMGSLDDWKDSFQTCQEEVVMYRQIQTWKCPFLLRYYGTHGPGLVFEYVDGESLDSLLFHVSDVDIEQQTWMWSELGFHISTALLYLHKLNISHNDIKPENVRYSVSKKCWKLLDLGLATDFDMKVSRQIGTDGYRSPEVAKTGYLNRKSDVFSLGVMMDDALEKLVTRYQVLEDIYDESVEIREQYDEEKKSKSYRQKGGEIDLDHAMVALVKANIKRAKYDSPAVTVTSAKKIIAQGAKYVAFLQIAREWIKAMLADDPLERPSVKRALTFFKLLISIETGLRDGLREMRSMGIY